MAEKKNRQAIILSSLLEWAEDRKRAYSRDGLDSEIQTKLNQIVQNTITSYSDYISSELGVDPEFNAKLITFERALTKYHKYKLDQPNRRVSEACFKHNLISDEEAIKMSWLLLAGRAFAKKNSLPYNKTKTTHETRRHAFDSLQSSIDATLMRHDLKPSSVAQIYDVIRENWHKEQDVQWVMKKELDLELISKPRFKNAMTEANNDLTGTYDKLEMLTTYKRTEKKK